MCSSSLASLILTTLARSMRGRRSR